MAEKTTQGSLLDERRLISQLSSYSIGNILLTLIGLISFPLWTRGLTTSDYGMLNLVNISVYFLTAFSKGGLQKSAIRFYSEFATNKRMMKDSYYYTTHIYGSVISSLLINGLFIVFVVFTGFGTQSESLKILIGLTICLAVTESISNILFAFMRAAQKVYKYVSWNVIKGYVGIGLSALLFFKFKMGLVGLLLGQLIIEAIVVTILTSLLILANKIEFRAFSWNYFKEALRYGSPLVLFESSKLILTAGDRYLIQFFMGGASLGLYSVAYNITTYVSNLLSVPVNRTVIPMYLEIWERHGPEKTKAFLESVFDYFLMIAIPLIFTFSYFSYDMIRIVASEKYLNGAGIVPFIVAPLIMQGAEGIYSSGLIIFKKTKVLMITTIIASIINIALNIVLIPSIGLLGAAIATLIAYVMLISITACWSFRYLPFAMNYRRIIVYIASSSIMILSFQLLQWGTLLGITIKVVIGFGLYTCLLITIDKKMRKKIFMTLGL